ncbi:hypothetical protein PENNAL_c0024G05166 [Penicillium nalgiovense]|uniref:Uncharacterized protein n=1 Tax=Penicillium nalgiovense TaxID=60175 RepID=A0A1V6YCN8_PENNA|nr:hypothetical protein PENNAL_c0024G05166 [Penicillium nalgiovense]
MSDHLCLSVIVKFVDYHHLAVLLGGVAAKATSTLVKFTDMDGYNIECADYPGIQNSLMDDAPKRDRPDISVPACSRLDSPQTAALDTEYGLNRRTLPQVLTKLMQALESPAEISLQV